MHPDAQRERNKMYGGYMNKGMVCWQVKEANHELITN